MKKITDAQKFSKLETRISKTITALQDLETMDLVYNKDTETESSSDYDQLQKLEDSLRIFIQNKLSSATANWWKEFIPNDVRGKAEERKDRNKALWPWHSASNLHPIYFMDFTDYSKIISKKDHWRKMFKPVFGGDVSIIVGKLKELEPIKHSIAHSRALTKNESERLSLYSKDIRKMIKK